VTRPPTTRWCGWRRILAALSAGRRSGQLWQPRRRRRGGDALHRGATDADRAPAARRDRTKHGRLHAELRRFDAEPRLLPARLPFVLLNGASGIAVGMATEIPSHNLREVAAATLLLLGTPKASLDDVLAKLPAPDFPGGGQIISSRSDIRDIYTVAAAASRCARATSSRNWREGNGSWSLQSCRLRPRRSACSRKSRSSRIRRSRPARRPDRRTAADQATDAVGARHRARRVRQGCGGAAGLRAAYVEGRPRRVRADLAGANEAWKPERRSTS